MTKEEFAEQDTALRHAVQSGIVMEQTIGPDAWFYRNNPSLATILKHLRTGVNCAMCEHTTLVRIFLDKGLITEAEYFEAALKTLHEEVARIENSLTIHFGHNITLR